MDSNVNGGRAKSMAVFRRDVSARTAGAISVSKGGYAIADTSTTARVGDLYRAETATTAAMVDREYQIIEASTNSFTIASKDLPTLGDTFFILGPVTLRTADDGSLAATISGSATEAKQDTMITSLAAIKTAVEIIDNIVAGSEAQVDVVSSALPSGASTSAKQDTAQTALDAIKTAVEIIDNAISGSEMQVDIVSSALPSGASTLAEQQSQTTELTAIKTAVQLIDNIVSGSEAQVDIVAPLPAGTNNIGDVDVLSLPSIPAGTNNIGDVDVLTLPVAYDAGTSSATTQRVAVASGATATSANVASSATSVTLLAASTSRLGATFFNDSTALLYLKFGATASATSYAVQIPSNGYYELPGPHIYNGIIDGIWASANGNCRVTSW